jgi:hypothetical protein
MLFVLVNQLAALKVNAGGFRFTRRSFHRYETSKAGGTHMKKMSFLIVAALFCAGLFFNAPVSSQGHKEKVRKNANRIENNYIVVLDDSVVGERGEYSIAGYMADDMARSYGEK